MLFIHNANQLITVRGFSDSPAKKEQMQELHIIEDGSLLVADGKKNAGDLLHYGDAGAPSGKQQLTGLADIAFIYTKWYTFRKRRVAL